MGSKQFYVPKNIDEVPVFVACPNCAQTGRSYIPHGLTKDGSTSAMVTCRECDYNFSIDSVARCETEAALDALRKSTGCFYAG